MMQLIVLLRQQTHFLSVESDNKSPEMCDNQWVSEIEKGRCSSDRRPLLRLAIYATCLQSHTLFAFIVESVMKIYFIGAQLCSCSRAVVCNSRHSLNSYQLSYSLVVYQNSRIEIRSGSNAFKISLVRELHLNSQLLGVRRLQNAIRVRSTQCALAITRHWLSFDFRANNTCSTSSVDNWAKLTVHSVFVFSIRPTCFTLNLHLVSIVWYWSVGVSISMRNRRTCLQ